MPAIAQHRPAQRLLVVLPSWVGDVVMATPTLRSLRQLYPQAQITALVKSAVRPVVDACPWVDRFVTIRPRGKGPGRGRTNARRAGMVPLARRLASRKFDTAVLLPNSFRFALLMRMAGIERRIGYERDGRGFLLTDRLIPRRDRGKFIPTPTRDYYLGIARYLGATDPDPTMALFTRPEDDARADDLLRRGGFDPARGQRLILINPGANYGDAKIWFAERFAAVADRLGEQFDAAVAVTAAPKERRIVDQVLAAARRPIIDLPRLGLDLGLLKSIVKRGSLMVTNDTGPRHIAAATGVPVVTIFGPTDPAWTEIGFAHERQAMVSVYCGPCQKKKCPLRGTPDELQCMKRVTVEDVCARGAELLHAAREVGASA